MPKNLFNLEEIFGRGSYEDEIFFMGKFVVVETFDDHGRFQGFIVYLWSDEFDLNSPAMDEIATFETVEGLVQGLS